MQEQTAKIVPDDDAMLYDSNLFAFGPKYLRMAACAMKTAIAPAMKNAGIRQVSTCTDKYSSSAFHPPCNRSMKTDIPILSSRDYECVCSCEAAFSPRIFFTQPGPTRSAFFNRSRSATITSFPLNTRVVASTISFRYAAISSQSME